MRNREGNTPLHVAAEQENREVELLLLDAGADVGAGFTALLSAGRIREKLRSAYM